VISLAVVMIWPGVSRNRRWTVSGAAAWYPGAHGGEQCLGEDVEVGLDVEDRFFGGGRPGRDHPGIQGGQERPLAAVRGPVRVAGQR
jgi:hypothetical protein